MNSYAHLIPFSKLDRSYPLIVLKTHYCNSRYQHIGYAGEKVVQGPAFVKTVCNKRCPGLVNPDLSVNVIFYRMKLQQ
jgi:hypothetical protein